jgi:hypothetical protein
LEPGDEYPARRDSVPTQARVDPRSGAHITLVLGLDAPTLAFVEAAVAELLEVRKVMLHSTSGPLHYVV